MDTRLALHPLGRLRNLPKKRSKDARLTRLTKLALALPETSRQIYGSHAQFLVRKKTFAYFLDNHHGDGIVAVTCKVLPGDNKALADAQPRRFYLPAYIASRGWVALRLDTGKVDWEEVRELLLSSYVLVAPRRLADLVNSDV
jgi:predicted DNA-binding protein (MmcQ/YjbR family)